jgi:uncharacterized protein
METSPFEVTLGDLNARRVTGKPVTIVASPDWHVELSRVLTDPEVGFDGEVTMTSGGLVVRGLMDGVVRHTCSRCLAEFNESVDVDVAQLVVKQGDAGSGDDDDYTYTADVVDLEPVLRDEMLLALPMLPVCPAGCEQLVEVADSDLNAGTPNDTGESVSPFAVLKDLLDHE